MSKVHALVKMVSEFHQAFGERPDVFVGVCFFQEIWTEIYLKFGFDKDAPRSGVFEVFGFKVRSDLGVPAYAIALTLPSRHPIPEDTEAQFQALNRWT